MFTTGSQLWAGLLEFQQAHIRAHMDAWLGGGREGVEPGGEAGLHASVQIKKLRSESVAL